MGKLKIALLTIYCKNYSELAAVTTPNMVEYCKTHGYSFREMVMAGEFTSDFGFHKISMVQRYFERGDFDVVMVCDLDVKITNMNCRVEDYIKGYEPIFIAEDVNGINAGVFIVQNTGDVTAAILGEIMALKGFSGIDNEQNAIQAIYDRWNLKNRIKILPQRSINAYPYWLYNNSGKIGECTEADVKKAVDGNWKAGCFVIHTPGLPLEQRIEILSNIEVVK